MTTRLYLRTPSRLHFGLLCWNPQAARQFGGVGLMIDRPGLELEAEPVPDWSADGPLADRALTFARLVADQLEAEGVNVPPVRFHIRSAPPEHVGLGTGTQLGLAVARAVNELVGYSLTPAPRLAELAGRGLRSGVGLHGFNLGGLIVDGGRRSDHCVPPLVAHHPFPDDWHVLVVIPPDSVGLHGPDERDAFRRLPPMPAAVTDHLCRLVLLGIMPALAESDLDAFGAAVAELQIHVGRCFAPAQGGLFASPAVEAIADALRLEGLAGVGQSSWGPTLYGFSADRDQQRAALLSRLRERFQLAPDCAFWTRASSGALCERI